MLLCRKISPFKLLPAVIPVTPLNRLRRSPSALCLASTLALRASSTALSRPSFLPFYGFQFFVRQVLQPHKRIARFAYANEFDQLHLDGVSRFGFLWVLVCPQRSRWRGQAMGLGSGLVRPEWGGVWGLASRSTFHLRVLPLRFRAPSRFRSCATGHTQEAPPPSSTRDLLNCHGGGQGSKRRWKNSGPFRKSGRDNPRKDHEFSGQR